MQRAVSEFVCAHGSVCIYVCKAGTGSVFCFRATSCGKDTADCLRACTPARTAQCVCAEAGARISVCVRVRERERNISVCVVSLFFLHEHVPHDEQTLYERTEEQQMKNTSEEHHFYG